MQELLKDDTKFHLNDYHKFVLQYGINVSCPLLPELADVIADYLVEYLIPEEEEIFIWEVKEQEQEPEIGRIRTENFIRYMCRRS